MGVTKCRFSCILSDAEKSEDCPFGSPRTCSFGYFPTITALSLFPNVPPLLPTRPRGPTRSSHLSIPVELAHRPTFCLSRTKYSSSAGAMMPRCFMLDNWS